MTYVSGVQQLEARDYTQVVFVQEIEGVTNQDVEVQATVIGRSNSQEKPSANVGDTLFLNEGEMMQADIEMVLLVSRVHEESGNDISSLICLEWDPSITDVSGGCARDTDAYRRILLT